MRIFISWSGPTSFQVAIAFRDFLHGILPELETWVSAEDIEEGNRWSADLQKILDQTSFCIICADPSNQKSNWLHFEAGAIAKSTEKWNIKILLYQLKPRDLSGPFTLYQPVRIEEDDVRRLLEDIYASFNLFEMSSQELTARFDDVWPDFHQSIIRLGKEEITRPISKSQVEPPAGDPGESLAYIDDVDEKILTLLFINEGIDEEKIATTVYLGRGECLKHLIELEKKNLVWSNLSFGTRRWYITDLGKKYLPGIYHGVSG